MSLLNAEKGVLNQAIIIFFKLLPVYHLIPLKNYKIYFFKISHKFCTFMIVFLVTCCIVGRALPAEKESVKQQEILGNFVVIFGGSNSIYQVRTICNTTNLKLVLENFEMCKFSRIATNTPFPCHFWLSRSLFIYFTSVLASVPAGTAVK